MPPIKKFLLTLVVGLLVALGLTLLPHDAQAATPLTADERLYTDYCPQLVQKAGSFVVLWQRGYDYASLTSVVDRAFDTAVERAAFHVVVAELVAGVPPAQVLLATLEGCLAAVER